MCNFLLAETTIYMEVLPRENGFYILRDLNNFG